jgi:hypothetical protein
MFITTMSKEEKQRAREAAQTRREQRIQEAIKRGAQVQKISAPLLPTEKETLINIDPLTGLVIVDTSVPKVMRRCIDKGWTITDVCYTVDGALQAMSFVGKEKGIFIRDAGLSGDEDNSETVREADEDDEDDGDE